MSIAAIDPAAPVAAAVAAAGPATPADDRDIHAHRVLILDFGAQYTQLIARRVRELGVYCEIHPWDMGDAAVSAFGARGIILSGGPESVIAQAAPRAPARIRSCCAALPTGRPPTAAACSTSG